MQGSIILQLPVSTMLPHNCILSLPSRQSNCCCCCCSPSTSVGIRHRFPSRRWLNISQSPCIPRFIDFYARCISNTSIQLDDVASDEDIEEELSPSASYCPGPIVHLKTDILDPNSLTLVTKQNLVDSILTSIPVLSEEEQKSLAATPAHPAGLYVISNHAPLHLSDLEGRASRKFVEIIGKGFLIRADLPHVSDWSDLQFSALYASCLAGNLVEHLWNFAWPAAIALIHPSLQPVAVMGFFNKLAIFVGGPLVGNLMDHFPRVSVYNCLSSIQAAAQLLSVAMIIHAYRAPISVSSVICRPWFVLLVLAGAVERLSGLALGVAMERDWVVLLAGRNRPIALAQANAVLSRIDLFCEILGASVFGILLSKYDAVTCLEVAASLMMGTLPVVVALNWLTNKLSAGVLDRAKCSSFSSENSTDVSEPYSENLVDVGVNAIKIGWAEYLHQPVLPASIAYVLLYFNVVLAPGGLMTAFLTQHGLNPSIIGVFSGLCAFMGVAATFMSAALVKRLGILKAGAAGLIFQALLLTTAVGVYWSGSLSHQTPLLFFLSLIVMSRLGHMSYDVVGQQILQTGIPSSKANLIGITEVSVASLAEFLMLGMAIVANDVSHFGLLAMLSVISVVGSAYVFCRWLLNPTEEQRNLFSFDSQF